MISLTHAPQIPYLPLKSLFLNPNCAAHSSGGGFILPRHRRSKCNRLKCFSADQSNQQPQNPRKQSQRLRKKSPPPDSDRKDGIDPAGFLAKHGITNKAFAQFLRERYKSLKDLKEELFKQYFDLHELVSGFELLGMLRNVQHRVDYMDWAPDLAIFFFLSFFNA